MAQSFTFEEALGGGTQPKAAPTAPQSFSFEEALGQTPAQAPAAAPVKQETSPLAPLRAGSPLIGFLDTLGKLPTSRTAQPTATAPQETEEPSPYKSREEALDDAVNLLEEGYPKEKVVPAFENAGIPWQEIVTHGVNRGSSYFQRRPEDEGAVVPPKKLLAPASRVKGTEPDMYEGTANLFKRINANLDDIATGFLVQTGGLDPDKAGRVIAQTAKRRAAAMPDSSTREGMKAIGDAKTYGDAVTQLAKNPAATTTMLLESVATSLLSSAPALVLGPAGAITRSAAQAFGSGGTEYASVVTDVLQDAGIDLLDANAVSNALNDPELIAKMKEKGAKRGLIVGLFDGLTMGFAGRFLRPAQALIAEGKLAGTAAKKATLAAWGKELAMQAGGGAGGEFLAQKATGENKPAEVLLEGLAELVSAPLEARANLKESKKLETGAKVRQLLDALEKEGQEFDAKAKEQDRAARVDQLTQDYIAAGVPPNDAAKRALDQVNQEDEFDEAAEADVSTGPVEPPGGAGVSVAGKPPAKPAAGGAGRTEPSGVVSPRQDAGELAGGEGKQQGALTGQDIYGRTEPTFSEPPAPQETPAQATTQALAQTPAQTPLYNYVIGLNKQVDDFYNALYSRPKEELPQELQQTRALVDFANNILGFVQDRLAQWDHPAITGENQGKRAAAKATATAEDRELLNLPSEIAGTTSRLINQSMALYKGYKGKKAGSSEKVEAAVSTLDNDYLRALGLLNNQGLLTNEEVAQYEGMQERAAIQAGEPAAETPEDNLPDTMFPSLEAPKPETLKLSFDPNLSEDEKDAAFAARVAAANRIAKDNFDSALDQVNDPTYGGDVNRALDSYYQNTIDTLAESGEKDPYVISNAISEFERLVNQYKAGQTPTEAPAQLGNEPFTIDVEARVVADAVNSQLSPDDLRRLTSHYGLAPNSEKFIARVKEDIVRFANEGAEAVAKAIRDIIKKLHAGVLSVAMIFNPLNITPPEFTFYPSYTRTTTEQVFAEVPVQAAEKMSPEARQAYRVLYPSIKDKLIKDNKFMVIADKQSARIFVFRPDGSLLLEKKSLFGLTKGDMYTGNTDLPQNRITPAGLFTMGLRDATRSASEARTAGEYDFKKVFVLDKAIDGEYSVTLFHSVWLHESDAAARAKALESESATDSRYSFGCINVDKPTYKFLIDNHLQQMDGASLFIVPDDPTNLATMLSGQERVGDPLTRTAFTPATETKTETVPLSQAETKPTSSVLDADRRRNVLNSITSNAVNSSTSAASNIADVVRANMAGVKRLLAEYEAGNLTAEQFAEQMTRLGERIEAAADAKRYAALTRLRGPERVMEALLEAKRKGRISPETADFAMWFLSQNPAMATNLGIKIAIPKNAAAQAELEKTSGQYSPFAQIVRIVTNKDPDTGRYAATDLDTAVHEILHHIERMLPENLRKLIRAEWGKQVKAALKKAEAAKDVQAKLYLEMVMLANAQVPGAAQVAAQMVKDGDVPVSMYALFDPSEFWAVRGSDLLVGRYGAQTRFARVKQKMRELVQALKSIFGMQSDHPIIKGLEAALRGDGTFVSNMMLNEGNLFTTVNSFAPKGLHADVTAAINNNDVTGAMKAMARNTSGFFSALAGRLAELDLPSSIGFDNQRALVRRIIDDRSAQQQLRLFSYLAREAPTLYDQYFKDYDKTENLERVAEGLERLESSREGFKSRGVNLAPVTTEFNTVREAYRKNMPGLTAPGFFAPTLDTINIRPDGKLGTNNRVVLHEVVHAATEYMLYGEVRNLTQEQNEAVADLNAMYRYAQTKLSPDEYGFTNLSEFVAEVMTNKAFQNKLKAIPYPPRKTTMWTAFKQMVAQMFGMDNVAGAAMSAIDDILSPQRPAEGVRSGPLKFAKGKRVTGPVSKPDTFRTAEAVNRTMMDVISDAVQGKGTMNDAVKDLTGALWSASGHGVRVVMLPMLQLRQLKDITKTKFPQFAAAVRIVEEMVAYRGQKIKSAEDIVQEWGKLQSKSPDQSRLMGAIMIEATVRGRDPESGVPPGGTPDALDNAWNSLDQEFKNIYTKVRDFYADSVNEMVRTMKQRAAGLPKAERQAMIKKINEQFGPDKLKRPYFPLRRFGIHWLQVGKGPYKEFYMFESAVNRHLAAKQRERELRRGNAQQRKLADTVRTGSGISELFSQNMSATQAIKELEETLDAITGTDVAAVKNEIKDSMRQLVYLLLPQQSMRKMFINRRAVQGMSSDMLRVFAHSAVHSAYQQARFKYAEAYTNNIKNARDYISNAEDQKAITPEQGSVYRDYVMELEKRTSNVLGIEDKSMFAKAASTVGGTVFYWMLSAPASAIVNNIGMAILTMPYIGGRYGITKTTATAAKYLAMYTGSVADRTIAPVAKGQFIEVRFPSIVESSLMSRMSPIVQRAAQRFVDDGDINISMTNDIFDLSEHPSELYTGTSNTVKKIMAGVFHQAERLNREVALLTTFELAFDKYNGADKRDLKGVVERDASGNPVKYTEEEAFNKAMEEARDIAGLTLGDFSRQAKGRIFQNPAINLITQFKQYAITATYATLRSFYAAAGREFTNAEIEQFREQMRADKVAPAIIEQRIAEAQKYRKELYREGFKRMAGTMGMAFLFGGVVAQPFFSLLGSIISLFAPDDDEDEDKDWLNQFYNYMQENFGGWAESMFVQAGMDPKKAKELGAQVGMAVARGPAGALAGTSLAERVSIDYKNMWWRDAPYSPELEQDVTNILLDNLGPFIGFGRNVARGIDQFRQGKIKRGFETILPKMFSALLTAERLANEGVRDSKGAVIMGLYHDQFTSWEIAMQALGFQPEKVALAQKAAIQAKTWERKVIDKRNKLVERLYLERNQDLPETDYLEKSREFYLKAGMPGFYEVLEEIRDFSMKYPEKAVTDKFLKDSFKQRDKDRAEAEAKGARLDNDLYNRTGPMTNYGWGNR